MKHREVVARIDEIKAVIGEQKILVGLVASGFSASTAEKIAKGDYLVKRFNRKSVARFKVFFQRVSRQSA